MQPWSHSVEKVLGFLKVESGAGLSLLAAKLVVKP
jgi:hypothetical protein